MEEYQTSTDEVNHLENSNWYCIYQEEVDKLNEEDKEDFKNILKKEESKEILKTENQNAIIENYINIYVEKFLKNNYLQKKINELFEKWDINDQIKLLVEKNVTEFRLRMDAKIDNLENNIKLNQKNSYNNEYQYNAMDNKICNFVKINDELVNKLNTINSVKDKNNLD